MVEDCPVDVVIVSYNTRDLICACVASVQGGGGPGSRIIVVDNASEDGTVEAVRAAFPDVTVIPMGRNAGFGAANNRGFRSGTSEFVLFLNPDTEVREERDTDACEVSPRPAGMCGGGSARALSGRLFSSFLQAIPQCTSQSLAGYRV